MLDSLWNLSLTVRSKSKPVWVWQGKVMGSILSTWTFQRAGFQKISWRGGGNGSHSERCIKARGGGKRKHSPPSSRPDTGEAHLNPAGRPGIQKDSGQTLNWPPRLRLKTNAVETLQEDKNMLKIVVLIGALSVCCNNVTGQRGKSFHSRLSLLLHRK